ncbi:MAG: hypothetical protein WC495_05030 [Patescibacteria group bacterium]|jgi:hypothetical protein
MKTLLTIVAALFALFVAISLGYGLVLAGGISLLILVPVLCGVIYYLWGKIKE